MPKNKELLTVLKNTAKLRGPGVVEAERNGALDELLKADANNPKEFRSAVLSDESIAFWQQMDSTIAPPSWGLGTIKRGARAAFVSSNPVQNDDFLGARLQDTPTLKEIKQAAAEQRVKFSLAAAQNDVLVGLLTSDFTDNGTILRQYLASRENSLGLKFGEIHGWNPSNEDVLTHASLAKIRIEAANQLLLKLIAKPELTDPKLFDDLTKATNIGEFQTAAKALITAGGITLPPGKTLDDITNGLAFDSVAVVVDAATKRRDNLLDLKAIAEFEKQLQNFKSTVSDIDLLGMKNTLKQGEQAFLDALAADAKLKEDLANNPYKARMANLKASKRTALGTTHQQPLCEQYLKAKILATDKAINDPLLLNPLKELNKDTLKTQLENFVGAAADADDKAIIGKAITDTNLSAFKVALTANIIKKIGSGGTPADLDSLKKLHAASGNLESFRKELVTKVGNGVTFDFVQEKDLPELRETLRDQIAAFSRKDREDKFKAAVEKYSRLGAVSHPKLMEVFKQLPDTKQTQILESSKQHELLFVINAKSPEEIKYYWGNKDANGSALVVDALVRENERAAAFKQIMNPTIAKVLMGLDYISPNKAMIDGINERLLANKDLDFTNLAHYKTLIDDIHGKCAVPAPNKNAFYKSFDLQSDSVNTLKVPTHPIADAVQDEHKKNKPLFDAHQAVSHVVVRVNGVQEDEALGPTQKKFVQILARVTGAAHLDIQGVSVMPLRNEYHITADVKNLFEKFKSSTNVHEFLDNLIPEAVANRDPLKGALKKELSREFTPSVYNELKGMRITSLFGIDDQTKLSTIQEINQDLERLQKSKSSIEKHKGHLEALKEDLKSLPALYSGANEVKAKNKAEKMIAEYKALEKQCDTVIVHLERVQAELQVRLDNTPAGGVSPQVKEQLDPLHEKLKKEITDVKEQLKFYKEIKQKISGENGALEQIKGIMKRELTAVVETASTTYSTLDLSDIKKIDGQIVGSGLDYFPIKAEARTPSVTTGATNTSGDSETSKLHKIPEQGKAFCINTLYVKPDSTEVKGRIAIDYHPDGSIPKATLAGNDVVSSRPIKVMIAVPVDDPVHRADQSLRAARELLKDWDGQSLIKLKGWSGKEKELAYLWTALNVLGEHHPKFSRDKISITGTANWKPDGERNWRGFTEVSVYNKVFKEKASGYTAEHVREFTSMIDQKKRDKVDKGVKNSTSFYRDTLSGDKDQNIEKEVEKDKKVEGTAKTLGG
ncbi:interaptin [Legionella sp. WA2022007384]